MHTPVALADLLLELEGDVGERLAHLLGEVLELAPAAQDRAGRGVEDDVLGDDLVRDREIPADDDVPETAADDGLGIHPVTLPFGP